MKRLYSNIPSESASSSADGTLKFFDQFYEKPMDIDNNALLAITAFFEKRGFESVSAEITAGIIMAQAKEDNLNAIKILDTLQGLSNTEISGLVAEILNTNRFKTSSLGIYVSPLPADEIQRNIIA